MAAGKWVRACLAHLRGKPTRPGAVAALCIAALALAGGLSGCSLIGLGVGAAVNSTRPNELLLLTPERAAYLPTGSPLTLVMTDSTTITGVVLDPQFPDGVDSRQKGVRLAHLHSERPATLDTLLVPIDRIAYARSPRPRHAARSGFRAGLVADLAVLGVLAVTVLLIVFILLMLSSSGFNF